MPANLPAKARAKWIKVIEARDKREKIKALEEFLSAIPKHKGTQKLVSHIRRQIALLKREIELERKKAKGGKKSSFMVKKEGDVQAVIIGLTNVGKSSFLRLLTAAKPEVSPEPYTTKKPIPGIFLYKDVYFQLVEAPALLAEAKSLGWTPQVMALCRNADALIIMVDLSGDPLYQLNVIVKLLNEYKITLKEPKVKVKITYRRSGGIQVIGDISDASSKQVEELLNSYGIRNALVRVEGKAKLEDIEESILFADSIYKPAIIVLNKADLSGAFKKAKILAEKLQKHGFPVVAISCIEKTLSSRDLAAFIGGTLLEKLGLIRIYTKAPYSKTPSKRPLVVKKGCTVIEVAEKIHSRLAKNFKYAKVWSNRNKGGPVKVGPNYELADGDVVEILAY